MGQLRQLWHLTGQYGMAAVLEVCMMIEGFWYFNILRYLIYLSNKITKYGENR